MMFGSCSLRALAQLTDVESSESRDPAPDQRNCIRQIEAVTDVENQRGPTARIHRDGPNEEVPRIDEMTPEDVSIPLEDIAERMADKTARAVLSHDRLLYSHLAQIYHELSQNRANLQRLGNLIQPCVQKRTNDEDGDINSMKVFYSCIDRFSERRSPVASLERCSAVFSGPADYVLVFSFPRRAVWRVKSTGRLR